MTAHASPALDQALAALRDTALLPRLRERRLPDGIGLLLRIASGERAALEAAGAATGEAEATVVEAAQLFIQQAMFFPGADSFRVLGLGDGADDAQVKQHHRWLVRWLHPDRGAGDWNSVYADRVNQAWQQLRTAERRDRYAGLRADAPRPTDAGNARPARAARPVLDAEEPVAFSSRSVRRMPVVILSSLALLAVLALVAQATLGGHDDLYALRDAPTPPATGPAPAPTARRKVELPAAVSQASLPSTDAMRAVAAAEVAARPFAAVPAPVATPPPAAPDTPPPPSAPTVANRSPPASVIALERPRPTAPTAPATAVDAVPTRRTAAPAAAAPAAARTLARTVEPATSSSAPKPVPASPTKTAARSAAPTAAPATTKQPPATRPASEPERVADAAAAAAAPPLPARRNASMDDARAAELSRRFRAAYASGDIEQIRALLARDPLFRRTDRRDILRSHQALFAASQARRMELRRPSWINDPDGGAVMIATFETWITPTGSQVPVRTTGDIRFDLRREKDGAMRIVRLRHTNHPAATAALP